VIIQPTSVAALTWLGAAAGASSEGWRIGTVLSARPLGISEQGLDGVADRRPHRRSRSPRHNKLPPQFQVRVLSLGAQPQLEILGANSQLDSNVNQALRERLPQQNGYAPYARHDRRTVAMVHRAPVAAVSALGIGAARTQHEHAARSYPPAKAYARPSIAAASFLKHSLRKRLPAMRPPRTTI
jgi:hypothetical protein